MLITLTSHGKNTFETLTQFTRRGAGVAGSDSNGRCEHCTRCQVSLISQDYEY